MNLELVKVSVNPVEAAEQHAENNEQISAAMNLQGANMIFSKIKIALQAVTSVTLVSVEGFITSITTTGGLLEVECLLGLQTSAATVEGTLQLFFDGLLVDSLVFGDAAGASKGRQTLNYKALVPRGQHKVEVKALTSSGTLTISPTNSQSVLRISEIVV